MIKKDLQKLAIRVEVCFKQFSEGFIKSELMKKKMTLYSFLQIALIV